MIVYLVVNFSPSLSHLNSPQKTSNCHGILTNFHNFREFQLLKRSSRRESEINVFSFALSLCKVLFHLLLCYSD